MGSASCIGTSAGAETQTRGSEEVVGTEAAAPGGGGAAGVSAQEVEGKQIKHAGKLLRDMKPSSGSGAGGRSKREELHNWANKHKRNKEDVLHKRAQLMTWVNKR